MFEKIVRIIVDQFGVEPESITMETSFEEYLGADFMDLVELAIALEEQYGVDEIPEEDLNVITTVGDLVNYLENR